MARTSFTGRSRTAAIAHRSLAEPLEARRLLTSIASGERALGSIAVNGEVDAFTFTAAAHDNIAVVVGDLSGTSFFPQIQVLAPDNSVLATNSGQVGAGIDLANLAAGGTYTINVSHVTNNFTGNYALSLFRAPTSQPTDADSGPISSGQRLTGTIDLGDLDVYTFTANAHDAVSLAFGDLSNSGFFPQVQVFGPNGQIVGSSSGQVGSGIDLLNLSQTGTYYAVVRMAGDTFNGNYALSMVRVPGAQLVDADSGTITSGQRLFGTIDLGDLDVYTFAGNAGDSFALAIGDLSATGFFPQVDVYAPDGTQLTTVAGQVGTGVDLANVSQSGTYYAVVRMAGDSFNGNYALSMVRVPAAQAVDADSGPILSGQRKTGTIDLGDIDVYTFTGNAQESLSIAIGDVSATSFFPEIQIFSPSGAQLASSAGQVGTGLDLVNLATTGTYCIVVRMAGDSLNGSYALSMVRVPGAQTFEGDSGPITSGQRLTGTIDLGDLDVYTFTASAGNSLAMAIGDVAGNSFFPQLDLYGPTGLLLATSAGQTGTGVDLTNLTQSGTYYAVVRMAGDSLNGDYALSLFESPATQTVDPDSGPITSGQRKLGAIDLGDLDVYTFTANAHETLMLAVGDIGNSSFFPEIQVFDPIGQRIGMAAGQTGTGLDLVNVARTGTYYAVVRMSGDSLAGYYALSMVRVPGAQAVDADSGALVSSQRRVGTIDLGDIDVYTFTANAGEAFSLGVADVDGTSFVPQLQVYAPNGALMSSTSGQVSTSMDALNVTQTGTYYVVVRMAGDSFAGNYVLDLARVPGAQQTDPLDLDGGAIPSGQTRSGAITLADLDVFTFSLASGNNATLNLSRLSGTFYNPRIDLYDPNGLRLNSQVGTTAASISVSNVLLSGTYYAVVRDSGDDQVGNYSIGLNTATAADTRAPQVTQSRFDFDVPRQRVAFVMNESIGTTLDVGDVTLQNLTGAFNVPGANITATFNSNNNEIDLLFPGYTNGILPDGNYSATLGIGSVTDTGGNPIGATPPLSFFFLNGDANRDRAVGSADFNILASNFGTPGRLFSQGNFSYDTGGLVDSADFNILASQFGKNLPGSGDGARAGANAGTSGSSGIFGGGRIGDDNDQSGNMDVLT